eukprot:TRINITY_DN38036_c0_g1_i1.p2 TRINITY_DN38036_c0_g1~~TRINITY_DN38036_c0_g1_i1.p2  ORF type:complete len:182 (+),score=10.22 TRINITY_DN38036_c0_g1_i1:157-702(+)
MCIRDRSTWDNNIQDISVSPAPLVGTSSIGQPVPPQSAPAKKDKSVYGDIPSEPVMEAVEGIKFDFNHGIRVKLPRNEQEYRVTFSDIDTGVILFSADAAPGSIITSVKKFYIRFRLIISRKGDSTPIFTHDYDATDKEVMIQLPVSTIGDSIGWFSYVERFQKKAQLQNYLCDDSPCILR